MTLQVAGLGSRADTFSGSPMKKSARSSAKSSASKKRRGLLFDASDLPRIRANTKDPRFAEYWQTLLATDMAADENFLRNELSLTNHTAHLLRAQRILDRTALIYLINRDAAQLALAKLAIRRMLDFPEWDSFIEGGRQILGFQRATEGTVALLLAIDYLGDALSAAEVKEIEDNVLSKGVPACYAPVYGMKFPDRVQGWGWNPRSEVDDFRHLSLKRWPLIINATNLKIIPTASLGIAACYFRGRLPEAEGWLELARSSAKAFSTFYGSDGAYDEGVSYWGYTTLYMALFAEVLWRTQGIDDRKLVNYSGTARYALVNTMPTIDDHVKLIDFQHIKGFTMPTVKPGFDIVNHGDSNGAVDVSAASWIARTNKDPVAQFIARNIGEAKQLFGFIWYDPKAKAQAPEKSLMDCRLSNDIVISRTGWKTEDSVLALRSGGPGNHEHADRNSVIFKAYGERLFHDPFRAAYVAKQPRWLLRQTEAHTAVLINGKGHQYHDGSEGTNASWSFARVTAFNTGKGWMTVTSDATDAYQLVNDQVTRVERTLVFLKPDVVIFLDRVALKVTPASVQVRFQMFNEDLGGKLVVSGNEFSITRPHASLHASVASTTGAALRAGLLPLEEQHKMYQYAEVASPEGIEHEILTVCTARPHGGTHGKLKISQGAGEWRVQGTHGGMKVNVRIDVTAGGAPVVTLK